MKICKNCGNHCPKEHKFCVSCGEKRFRKVKKLKESSVLGDHEADSHEDDFEETRPDLAETGNIEFSSISSDKAEPIKETISSDAAESMGESVYTDEAVSTIVSASSDEVVSESEENTGTPENGALLPGDTHDVQIQTQEPRFWENPEETGLVATTGKNRTRNMLLVLAAFAVAIGVFLFVWIPQAYVPYENDGLVYGVEPDEDENHDYAQVPDVLNMSLDGAVFLLHNSDFQFTFSFMYNDTVPEGYVISQYPLPDGRAARLDTIVGLVVSQGPLHVEIPSFTGQILSEALVFLEQNNFRYQVSFDYEPVIPVAHVISSTWGELPRGTVVDIVVSLGPLPVVEPIPTPEPEPTPQPTVTIFYNPNSGTGFKHPVQVIVNENHIVLPNTFVRSNHSFVGWNTNPQGTGTLFLPGSTIARPVNDITLFAIWQAAFVQVERILNLPASGRAFAPIPLTGTVYPENATIRSPIIWSVFTDGGTGAMISGNFLTAINTGEAVISATVPGGRWASPSIDFTYFFRVQIDGIPPAIVGPISHRAAAGLGGTLQIRTVGEPTAFSIGGHVPIGVGINDNGLLTWTATTPYGAHSFWITASNRYGTSGPFTVNLTIE